MLAKVTKGVSFVAAWAVAGVAYGIVALMILGFALGVPLAIIDFILPGSPIGLQDWARNNRN